MEFEQQLHAVTGAFGYSGRRIAELLLGKGHRVMTLTNSPYKAQSHHPLAGKVEIQPFNFDKPERLAQSLAGVSVLYNTYWIRFNHRTFSHAEAVENTRILFDAAKSAGVCRIVHVSITNPSENSDLEYFRGKAVLERALQETEVPHAVLRPAVLFGDNDILINNIAWALRHLPVFGVFGDGRYRLQPIHVKDFAKIAVQLGESDDASSVTNAIGPETFTYRELAATLAKIIGVRRPVIGVPPAIGYLTGKILGRIVGDVMLTREEIKGLMDDLLYVDTPPTGTTLLTEWAATHCDTLGREYASELARRKGA